ncbi:F-box/LRR-repeat protein-like protein [Salvia divinorum]|uniref:F-box/LRR-repeat protein-like protein n=1 Tax=Salvia divinorum TaxID=28513 RepID=A0ABD1FTR7_SALDI
MDGTHSNQLQPCDKHKKKKRKTVCDNGSVDRISGLPDEIIHIMLSFLPLREAAATSLLSNRWSDLWKHSSNLDFVDATRCHNMKTTAIEHESWDVSTCKNVKMVNSVLESHQALFLKEFRLQFYINSSAQSTITKWLEFVWSRQVERLNLKFICYSPKHMVVLGDLVGEMRPMQHLKILSLRSLMISGEDISLFLRNCPLLRELNIEGSHLTSEVNVCDSTLVLENLRIRKCNIRESFINISAPNLAVVSVDARPGQLWFENVPSLISANFAIDSSRYTMQHFASAVCCITSQLQKLMFSLYIYPKKLSWNGFPKMPNLKKLYVKESSLYEHECLLPLKSVISACPCLQKFKIEFHERVKNATPNVERCPHQYLKMIKFQGSCATDIIRSMTYISDCCDAFQKIKTCTPVMSKADVQAHREHMHHLQLQLSRQVQLKFFKSIDK